MGVPRVAGVLCVVTLAGCGPTVASDTGADGSGSADGSTTTGAAETTAGTSVGTVTTNATTSPVTTLDDSGPLDTSSGTKLDVAAGDTEGCLMWAYEGCAAAPQPDSTVSGTTPLGEYDVPYGFFAAYTRCDDCVDSNVALVYLVADPAAIADVHAAGLPVDGLVLELDVSGFTGPLGETTDGYLTAVRDGEIATSYDATFVLQVMPGPACLAEPFDAANPEIVVGRVDVEAPGWSVHGELAAAYCPQLNFYAICE